MTARPKGRGPQAPLGQGQCWPGSGGGGGWGGVGGGWVCVCVWWVAEAGGWGVKRGDLALLSHGPPPPPPGFRRGRSATRVTREGSRPPPQRPPAWLRVRLPTTPTREGRPRETPGCAGAPQDSGGSALGASGSHWRGLPLSFWDTRARGGDTCRCHQVASRRRSALSRAETGQSRPRRSQWLKEHTPDAQRSGHEAEERDETRPEGRDAVLFPPRPAGSLSASARAVLSFSSSETVARPGSGHTFQLTEGQKGKPQRASERGAEVERTQAPGEMGVRVRGDAPVPTAPRARSGTQLDTFPHGPDVSTQIPAARGSGNLDSRQTTSFWSPATGHPTGLEPRIRPEGAIASFSSRHREGEREDPRPCPWLVVQESHAPRGGSWGVASHGRPKAPLWGRGGG